MNSKILYVEDEPFLGKIVKESLESRRFQVQMVADGRVALAAFEQLQPDVCVLDVMLPHKDGYTIAQEIRAISPNVPILFLTAKTQTEDLLKGFQVGGNDYIKKPFSLEELIVRIDNLLALTQNRGNITTPEGYVAIGNYQFWEHKYELIAADGQLRKISHREAELIKLLVAHRNQTVSRKLMLLQVWGDDSFFNSRNLDVYITKLRSYFAGDNRIEIITIKGVGYHFVAG